MGLFDKIFSSKPVSSDNESKSPDIQFGRYTDRDKSQEQLDAWKKCQDLFKEKKYLDAYSEFFNYLCDKRIENVTFSRDNGKINFEFIQGSKVIKGYASEKEVAAEAKIASFENKPHVAVMRKLLMVNYNLLFSKFALKDNVFTMLFSAPSEDCEPTALYYSLKEIANESDKYDDVLTEEFDFLKPLNVDHIQELPEEEKIVKYEFLKNSVKKTMERMEELDPDEFSGAHSFLLLNLTFKLYYLLAPEGVLLDNFRYLQGLFFRRSNETTQERVYLMKKEFNKILNTSKEDILKSLYKVKGTFAVVKPTNYETVSDFIKDELPKIDWYMDNDYPDIQQAVCEYIVAYSEFHFGMDAPVYDLFNIFWKAINSKYYKDLGYTEVYYDTKNNKFEKQSIESRIYNIINGYKAKFPFIAFKTSQLKYDSLPTFAYSFLSEMKEMNLELN